MEDGGVLEEQDEEVPAVEAPTEASPGGAPGFEKDGRAAPTGGLLAHQREEAGGGEGSGGRVLGGEEFDGVQILPDQADQRRNHFKIEWPKWTNRGYV